MNLKGFPKTLSGGMCTPHWINKLFLTMKLTAFIVLSICLQVSARSVAQQTITLSEHNAALETVLQKVHDQTGYEYFFKAQDAKNVRVTIDVKNTPVDEVLPMFFQGKDFTYEIVNKIIVVKKREEIKVAASQNEGGRGPTFEFEGTVVDESGEPLSGASIKLNNGSVVAITDVKGRFKLKNINEDATIEISYTGYASQKVKVGNQTSFKVSLSLATNKLDQVQVVAYGTTTQRLNTGNVSKVTSKEIEEQPVSNVLAALEGRVPGLVITQSTGVPGGAFTVQIRGQNSIGNGNDPFYVIDGVPYNSSLPTLPNSYALINSSLRGGNPLNYINPNDIESIEVLKDADATSIYGSRAANGAILITTKKGKAGAMKLDLNFSSGFTKPSRDIPLLNTQQYLAMRHEAFSNDVTTPQSYDYDVNGVWDTSRYTNWSKVLTNNSGAYTNAQASIAGGNTNTQYFVGAGYNRQTTGFPKLLPGDGSDQKGSVHFNMNTMSGDKRFKLVLTGNYVSDKNTAQSEDFSNDRLALAPDAPSIFNKDGSLNWAPIVPGQGGTWTNPYSQLFIKYKQATANLVGNSVLSYALLPNLDIKASLGYTTTRTEEVQTYPTTTYDPDSHITSGSSYFNTINNHGWIIEPQINYRLKLGQGLLGVLLGSTFQETNAAIQHLSASGFISDALLENSQAANSISVSSNSTQYKYDAVFGRLNYNWEDKYLLNLVARRDGSSRFGPGKQFGNFGAIGAAWIFSKEKFVQNSLPFLSFGKLRTSYGATGNDGIADYQFLDLYTSTSNPYQGIQGLYPINLFNADLAWEVNKKLEAGLELGVLKDRIIFQISYYQNRSSNQLVTTYVSTVTGFGSIPYNLPALVQNSGKELTVNTINVKSKNFTWSSSFNLTMSENKLMAFPNLANSAYSYLKIGQPINIVPLYHLVGINDTTGLYQFSDYKGTPTYSPNYKTDRTGFVNTTPKFYGGFQNSFTYKGFSLDVLFQFAKQMGKNLFSAYPVLAGTMANLPTSFLDRWQKPGDKAKYQKFSQDYSGAAYNSFNYATQSDFGYSDASFIRLKNLAISWQLSKPTVKKLHLENCRIYLQGQNLFTITNYNGIDPESQGTGLPPMRVWTAGFQMAL